MSAVSNEPTTTAIGGKPYTAPAKQNWGWAAGRVAEFGLIGTYGQAMNVFTVGFGLNPVIVSWCMMLPRLFDGILDPIIGHWSDDMHTRWGRRKPFLIGGAFLGSIFLALLWWANPSWSPAAQFLHLFIVGTCLYLCYGAYLMAWTAISYELSDDYHERSRIAAIGGFFLAAMALSNSWIYWFTLRPMFGSVIWGMRWVGLGMAVLVIISAIITAISTKERFTHTNRRHVPIIQALKTTMKNRPFVYLILMKICEIFGGRLTGGIAFYLGVYYVCQGDLDLSTRLGGIGATLGTVWNFTMLPLVKPASKFIGKRGALIVSAAIGFGTSLISPFITTPAHPWWGLIPGLIVAPLLVITGTIAGAIVPDICDVDELESGQRREGLFASVMGFVGKLEISLAVVLVGYVVQWAAVDTNIGHRWEATINDNAKVNGGFPAGEKAVFSFKDRMPATFNTFSVAFPKDGTNMLKEFELLASDESPTTGFHSIGKFQAQSSKGMQEFKFAPVTAKYFEVKLISAQAAGTPISLNEIRLTNTEAGNPSVRSSAVNLLGSAQGGRMLAAQPPEHVQHKLFWLVMIPGIVFSGLTFIMTLLFPLTEAQMLEVRRKLDERRLAKAAAGEPTDEITEELVHEHPEIAEAVQEDI